MSPRDPWWGPREGPANVAQGGGWPAVNPDGGRSGEITYGQLPLSTSLRTPDLLSSLTSPEPIPVVAHVQVTARLVEPSFLDTSSPLEPKRAHLFAGSPDFSSLSAYPLQQVPGMLVLEYGDLSVSRRVACDLRSGTYQFPPCQQVRVASLAYAPFGPAFAGVKVVTSLSPGFTTQPSRPFITMGRLFASPGVQGIHVPDGSRWMDAWAEGDNYATCRIEVNYDFGTGQPVLVRDYSTNTFTPPWGPVEMAHHGPLNVRMIAGTNTRVWVRFFQEL